MDRHRLNTHTQKMIQEKQLWNDWACAKGWSEVTRYHYNYYLGKINPDKITDIEYLTHFIKRHNNNVCRAFISKYIEFLRINKIVPSEQQGLLSDVQFFLKSLKYPSKKRKKAIEVLRKEEVHELARNMPNYIGRTMVLLTFYCGLRCKEVLGIRYDDIDFGNQTIIIRKGKGSKERILPLIPEVAKILADYINNPEVLVRLDRELKTDKKGGFLFNISGRTWRRYLANGSKTTFGRSINPHLLRHSVGTYLHAQGMDIKEIGRYLGHEEESINITAMYIHLDTGKLNKKVVDALRHD